MTRSEQSVYAIEYLRPDGWWEAGRGWKSRAAAHEAGKAHNWRGSTWRVRKVTTKRPTRARKT